MSSSSKSTDGAMHQRREFRCSMCRVTCVSEVSFQAHNRGAKHMKALRAYGPRGYEQRAPRKLTSLRDFINDPDRTEPLIGLKYVEEGKKNKGKRHYRCTLCELDMAMQIMFDHLVGHKHRRSYLNKHFPLLIKGVQTPTVAVIKKLAKEVEDEEGMQHYATNVNIKLQPQSAKKRSANSFEQSVLETMEAQPMQTNADDFLENMATPQNISQPSSSHESDYHSQRQRDYSPPQYKKPENTSKYHSSRDSEYQTKRSRDYSPPQYKPQSVSQAKPAAEYKSSQAYESSGHHSISGYNKDYQSTATHESGSGYSHSGYNQDYDQSRRTQESGSSHATSGYSKNYDQSTRTHESSGQISSSGYNKEHEQSTRTYDSGSHNSSGTYNQDYAAQQGSSGVQSAQQTTSSGPTDASPGGLSPDILKILQGKDVPTVTSILSRLAQYYPPLQNVDISLLVSVLFESGALK
ncbi:uncharacterized protein [Ambystoma mexicanum]|uniref:uncharacterized protein n=1 Tax=Ambystoma mexicanum TaxID=8296 RepID=UPI0037E760A8